MSENGTPQAPMLEILHELPPPETPLEPLQVEGSAAGAAPGAAPEAAPGAAPAAPPASPPTPVREIPPPPDEPQNLSAPEIYQKLSVLFLEVLPRVGLEKLHNIMAVYVRTIGSAVVVDGKIQLEVFHQPLDQNHVPAAVIGQVLAHMVLYARRFILTPVLLPKEIEADTEAALVALPEPDALLLDLYRQGERRLEDLAEQARRDAEKAAEVAEETRLQRREAAAAAAAAARHAPLLAGVDKKRIARTALVTLLFLCTVGYWVHFVLTMVSKEKVDPRSKLNLLEPEVFSSVTQVERARVSNGTLFVQLPPGRLQAITDHDREVLATKLLDVANAAPDVKNVNLRDESLQVQVTVRR